MAVRRRSGQSGFTLIELLTSIAILLILVGMLTVTFNTASNTWRAAEREVERFQDARLALDLIARDLQQVYVSSNVSFLGTRNSLAFVATANDDTNFVDLMEVVYRLNTDETPTPPFALYRRTAVHTDPEWDFYQPPPNGWPSTWGANRKNLVCTNVVSLSLVFFKTNQNNNATITWNSAQIQTNWTEPDGTTTISAGDLDMSNAPPAYIDVRLSVVDSKTAALMRQTTTASALTNLTRQATRTFAVFVKIPQR